MQVNGNIKCTGRITAASALIGSTALSEAEAGLLDGVTPGAGAASKVLSLDASGDHSLPDGGDIALGTGTGTKLGTAANQKFALWGATPVVQPASANQAVLALDLDVSGSDTVDKSAIDSNFAAIQTLMNQLRADLIAAGAIKGSA